MSSSPESGRDPTKLGATKLGYSVSSVSARTQRAATTISLPLHMKLKEKSVSNLGPPIQDVVSMVPIRTVVIFTFLFFIILLTVASGYLFLWIEKSAPVTVPVMFESCFEQASKAAKTTEMTNEETIASIKACVLKSTSINTPNGAFMYAWGLSSTVGYGDRYPHTFWGQLTTLLYSWFSIPLFMAFKIEMGEIIALTLLYIGRGIFYVFQKCYKWIRGRRIKAEEPGDALLSFLLSLVFGGVLCFTATIFMLIDDIGWWSAFYSSGITVMLVGLGDYVPGTNWQIFAVLLPLFLFGDVLASYLFYYMHGLMRIRIHTFAEWCTTKKGTIHPASSDTDSDLYETEPVVAVNATRRTSMFPIVTTTSMPFSRELSQIAESLDQSSAPIGTLSIRRKSMAPRATSTRRPPRQK